MLNEELIEKIANTLAGCEAHNSRMRSALKKLSPLFPLSVNLFVDLKEVRNLITHDYPHMADELVDGLNQLALKAIELSEQYEKVRDYIQGRLFNSKRRR